MEADQPFGVRRVNRVFSFTCFRATQHWQRWFSVSNIFHFIVLAKKSWRERY